MLVPLFHPDLKNAAAFFQQRPLLQPSLSIQEDVRSSPKDVMSAAASHHFYKLGSHRRELKEEMSCAAQQEDSEWPIGQGVVSEVGDDVI